MNKTKIVATIGPATYDEQVLSTIIDEGVNVCRLNFSHGSHEEYVRVIEFVRKLNEEKGNHTAILADLQGPKLRLGDVENGEVEIVSGDKITLTSEEMVGNAKRAFVSYPTLANDIAPGARILIDDGKVVLKVLSTDGKSEVEAEIVQGGVLRPNKGTNFPDTKVSMPCLTEKDYIDLKFALDHDIEWIALSFVRSADDIREVKKIIEEADKTAKVIAKIEKPEALEVIDEIIEETDALMVARGDLGVEIPMQDVPIIQKELVRKCRRASKPVIIATQMIESMIDSITPTRAEVNDVANAVMDGADAVMLSAETSLGNHPVEVIKAIYSIVEKSETFDEIYFHYKLPDKKSERFISDSICFNATKMAERVEATAIVTMSFSGYTGRKISSNRPRANTFVFTANQSILNMLSLIWGVRGFYYDRFESTDGTISDIMEILKKEKWISKGDLIINITSMPITDKAKSNMLKLSEVL
ncbi:MAG: pyruvate kinase [Flavobacteriales bacterium]|nr:pyruvate kinase [Flavobacteriales bacterium]